MRLSKITIDNFRGIKHMEVELDRDMTVLVGENNVGKTSVLEALRLCLDVVKSDKTCNFSEYDFYRDDTRTGLETCEPVSITLSFLESEEHLWHEHVTQALNEVIVGSDYSVIKFRVTAQFDVDTGQPVQSWSFLDDADNELVGRAGAIKELRRLRPFFFQTALRAARDQFHGQSTYWASFLKNRDIDETTQRALEEELYQVNQKIVDAHTSFRDVTEEVKRISDLVSVGQTDAVTVDPAPADVYKALRYTDVNLLTASNAKIPIRSHGEGTQSLSVLLLFSAYLKTRLQADVDRYADPIIAIEEPEAHLHPNAVRAVWQLLNDLPGQKIVATHSGDILSEVPVSKLRRMSRDGDITQCMSLPDGLLTDEELRKLNHHVRRNRGELFFARCWLLVEGETDVSVFTDCAPMLGIDLHRAGVRIVEYSQVDQNAFIKLADALGIRWFLVSDGDAEGERYARSAKSHLNGRDENLHVRRLTKENMEVLLCESGYGAPYESRIGEQQRGQITLQPEAAGYWTQVCGVVKGKSKPAAVLDALLLMREKQERGESAVPLEIEEILRVASGETL